MNDLNDQLWQELAASLLKSRLDDFPSNPRLQHVNVLLEKAHADGAFPCAVLAIAYRGKIEAVQSIGEYRLTPEQSQPVTSDSVFDLASMTKVVATWLTAGWLDNKGLLNLSMTLDKAFPLIASPFSRDVTMRMLMTYTAGLPRETRLDKYATRSRDEIARRILEEALEHPIASKVNYSNRHLILLGEAVSALARLPFDVVSHEMWKRCGMLETSFNPPSQLSDRIVSTELESSGAQYLRGTVHDENARTLGGVAGHAGVFSTAKDLLMMASVVLSGGRTYAGEQVLQPEYLSNSFADATRQLGRSRGLVWDLGSFGASDDKIPIQHGFTGTSLVVSKRDQLAIVFLTNAVQLSRDKTRLETFRQSLYEDLFSFFR